jgi:hypothetical protein
VIGAFEDKVKEFSLFDDESCEGGKFGVCFGV